MVTHVGEGRAQCLDAYLFPHRLTGNNQIEHGNTSRDNDNACLGLMPMQPGEVGQHCPQMFLDPAYIHAHGRT